VPIFAHVGTAKTTEYIRVISVTFCRACPVMTEYENCYGIEISISLEFSLNCSDTTERIELVLEQA